MHPLLMDHTCALAAAGGSPVVRSSEEACPLDEDGNAVSEVMKNGVFIDLGMKRIHRGEKCTHAHR